MKNNRLLAVILAIAIISSFVNVSAAFTYVTQEFEPSQVEITIEAEDFKGNGFSVAEDSTASGGKVLVGSGSSKESMTYTLSLDTDVEKLTVYGVHKSAEKKQALSYITFEGFEHYSLYDYEYGVWNSTRLFFDTASKGDYTLKLTSVRAGQKIDKIIVKYNKVQTEEKESGSVVTTESETDTSKYKLGDPALEAAKIAVMEEGVPGSFMAECEDGIYKKMYSTIVKDEKASGGEAWVSSAPKKLQDSNYEDTDLRFKFYVSQNGTYKLWARYLTPNSEAKDAFFAIDDQAWKEISDSAVTGEYKWKSTVSADLGIGWHTINIKHRSPGWQLDKVLLTSDSKYTPSGIGSLPGTEEKSDDTAAKLIAEKRLIPKMKSNNYRFRSDAEFEFVGDDIMVPSTNISSALGITQSEMDGYFILTRDRQYMKIYDGSDRIISSGKVIKSIRPVTSLPEEDDILMVPLKAAQETFGFDYEYDASENTIHIFDFYEEPYVREATDDELQLEIGNKTLYYTIPYDNPDAKVEVWLRYDLHDINYVRNSNFDNLNKLSAGGNDYKLVNQYSNLGANTWFKGQTPVYKDGAFRGVQFSSNDYKFIVKVIITDNGKQDVFMKNAGSYLKGWGGNENNPPREYAYDTNGELYLVPTFENISYYIDTEYDNADCKITYRKAGEGEWKNVLEPTFDPESKQFRGTIPFVNENTEYEVNAEISINGNVVKKSTAAVKTWADNPPVAQTIKLKDIYKGSGDLTLMGYKGTEDGWIKIDGEGMTVDAGKEFYEAVTISDCQYLIFENVVVRGGTGHGIIVDQKCNDIRIVNCDIAEWGTGSVQDKDFGVHFRANTLTNQQAGIQGVASVNLVVERCYIHDSDTNTNSWNGNYYTNRHPQGSAAIMMWGQRGTVIRYNDLIGSNVHRYNDVLEGASNGARGPDGSCGSDSDIYGNLLIFSNDDGMELDGAQMNVRVYQNRVEQTYCGISTAPNKMGPSYIYRNMIVKLNDSYGRSGTCMKIGGCADPWTYTYMFNNTFRTTGGCIRNAHFGGYYEWHGMLRNNIIAGYNEATEKYNHGRALENTYANETDDYDYDLIAGTTIIPAGSERNAVYKDPVFVNDKAGDFRPAEDSPTYKAGTTVDSFTGEGAINIGAFAGDENDELFIPARPVDFSSDKYVLRPKVGEVAEATLKIGNIEEGLTYSLLKNRDFGFIEILNEETENVSLKPNSEIKLKVKCNEAEDGVVVFRLSNGYSIPVIVYCEGE